jgi:tetratricopeptide (TPR) repeat protein
VPWTLRKLLDGRELTTLACILALAAPGAAKGPPPRCALAEPPLRVYERFLGAGLGPAAPFSEDERRLLEEVWDKRSGRLAEAEARVDEDRLLEAMLFASGVQGRAERQKYRDQFNDLVARARRAVAGSGDNFQRGERLMRFLHKDVMSKGYEAQQTSFTAVFDSNKYNCVSATAFYYLVGTKLGLDLRAISIPGTAPLAGHATLDLLEGGRRVQVEATNPDGFDWQTKVSRPGVIVLGFVPDRKSGHEVHPAGIPAMVYSNRGVAAGKKGPEGRGQAVRCYLAALALDPTDRTATQNLQATFGEWSHALVKQQKFEDAARVLGFARAALPGSHELRTNLVHAYSRYVEATLASGKDEDALALLRRAARAVPEEREFRHEHDWFVGLGEKRVKEKGWEAGLEVADRGLKVLPAAEGKKLKEWQAGVYRRWSQSLLDRQDFDGSVRVLARAYALGGDDREVRAGIAYHAHKALPAMETKSGVAGLVEHYQALVQQFPRVTEVAEAGQAHATQAVLRLAGAHKFEEALETAGRYRPLLARPEQRAEVGALVYDRWARHLAGQQQWEAALAKYAQGLQAFPGQARLTNNAAATVDEWARAALSAKQWEEAIGIYKVGLKYFPEDSHLRARLSYCEKMRQGG